MKYWRVLCAVLLAAVMCVSAGSAGYSMVVGYEVPELYISLDFPLSWAVLTRDADEANPALYLYDDSLEYMQDSFEANDIYLDAFQFESMLELTILMTPDTDIFDLGLWDESFVDETAKYLAESPVWAGDNEVQCFRVDDYYLDGVRFLTFNRVETQDDYQLRCLQMTTIFNGQTIHLILTDYSGTLSFDSGSLADAMHEIVDSLTFTEVLATPESVAGNAAESIVPETSESIGSAQVSGVMVEIAPNLISLVVVVGIAVLASLFGARRARSASRGAPMRRTVPTPRQDSSAAQTPPAAGGRSRSAKSRPASERGRPVQPIPRRRPKHNCAADDPAFAVQNDRDRSDETVFCIDCGHKIRVAQKKCPYCGARVV